MLKLAERFLSKVVKKQLISSQLLTVKMQKGREKLKKELLSKNEPRLEDLENSQPIYTATNKKAGSKRILRGMAE